MRNVLVFIFILLYVGFAFAEGDHNLPKDHRGEQGQERFQRMEKMLKRQAELITNSVAQGKITKEKGAQLTVKLTFLKEKGLKMKETFDKLRAQREEIKLIREELRGELRQLRGEKESFGDEGEARECRVEGRGGRRGGRFPGGRSGERGGEKGLPGDGIYDRE